MDTLFKKYSLPGILTGLFLFVLPFVFSRHLFYGASNAKYFFMLYVVYFFVLILGYRLITGKISLSLRKRTLLIILGVLILYNYISTFLGINPTMSLWSDIIRSTGVIFVTHLALLSFVLSELLKKADWDFVRRSIIWSSSIFSFFYILGSQGLSLFKGIFLSVDFSLNGLSVGNETFAGAFVFLSLVLTFIEISKRRAESSVPKILWVFLFLQIFNPLMFNFSIFRGGSISGPFDILGVARASSIVTYFSLFYFVIRSFLLKGRNQKYIKGYNIALFSLVSIFAILLFIPNSPVQNKYIDLSTGARIITWDSALESLKDRPVTGFGPENFGSAVQENFNNSLYLRENIGEIWFDRAHNVVIEGLVTKGIIGVLLMAILIGFILRTLNRSSKKGLISREEANLLGLLFLGHVLQIFTSFDTVITYTVLAVLFGYVMHLELEMTERVDIGKDIKKTIGLFLVILVISGIVFVLAPEKKRQSSLYGIFISQSHDMRMEYIDNLDNGKLTFEPLRFGSAALIKGAFESPEIAKSNIRNEVIKELGLYVDMLEMYVEENKEDYRSRMNLVYVYFAKTILGENELEKSLPLIESSYELSPENPLTYVMHSLYHLYSGDADLAEEKLNEAIALNPEIPFTIGVLEYFNAQKAALPQVAFLKLENL